MGTGLEEAVEGAIALVDDPCSIAAKAPLNIFELGLVREWSVNGNGDVHVTLSPTSPSCILIGSIMEGVEQRVGEVAGVRSVTVELDGETFWTPELMSAAGHRKLAERRHGSMARVPVKPRQWQRATAGPGARG